MSENTPEQNRSLELARAGLEHGQEEENKEIEAENQMSVGSFEAVVRRAYSLAGEYRHEFVTLEHLLLALVEIDDLTNTLQAVGGDVKKLRADVKSYIEDPANHSVIKSIIGVQCGDSRHTSSSHNRSCKQCR